MIRVTTNRHNYGNRCSKNPQNQPHPVTVICAHSLKLYAEVCVFVLAGHIAQFHEDHEIINIMEILAQIALKTTAFCSFYCVKSRMNSIVSVVLICLTVNVLCIILQPVESKDADTVGVS